MLSHVTNDNSCTTAIIMSLEATFNLSVLELLQILNEKFSLEYTRTRGNCFPPILGSISSLEAEVSRPWSIHLNGCDGEM